MKKHNQPQPKTAEVHIFSPHRYEGWLQHIDKKWTFCRDSALRGIPKAWHCSPDGFKQMNPDWIYLTLKQSPEGCQVFRGRDRLGVVRFSEGYWIAYAGNQEHRFNYRYEAIALVLNYPEKNAIAC